MIDNPDPDSYIWLMDLDPDADQDPPDFILVGHYNEIFWKVLLSLHLIEMDTDPDWQALDADADADPEKWCRCEWIRIHNTD
jgi:hypothetical protein